MFIVPIHLQAFLFSSLAHLFWGHIWGHIAKSNFGGFMPLTVLQIAALHPLDQSARRIRFA